MRVVAVLNQKGGVGKTTMSVHLATALSAGKRVLLIDADPQHSAIDWSAQRAEPACFTVMGLPMAIIHRDIARVGHGYDWVVIDGPPRVNDLARSAIGAAHLVVIPVQPSPYDVWAAKDIISLVRECNVTRPVLSRFLLNRLRLNTTLAGEVVEALAEYETPVLASIIRDRTAYAKSARAGYTALETEPNGEAAEGIRALAAEVSELLREVPHGR